MAAASPQPERGGGGRPASSGQKLTTPRALGIGLELGTAIAGMAVLGYFLDRHFQTRPLWTLVCTGAGLLGGVYNAIRAVRRLGR